MLHEMTALAPLYKAVFKLFSYQVCRKNRWAGDRGSVIPATCDLDTGEATAHPSRPSPGCGNWQRRRSRREIWADPALRRWTGSRGGADITPAYVGWG